MTKESMTVHKALSERKLLDSKIVNAIDNGTFCVANKHSNRKINGVNIEDFEKNMQGQYDKASDYIARYYALQKAINLSNAKTIVTIAGEDYTVAEAIWMNNHGMDTKQMLVNELRTQYNKAIKIIDKQNGDDLEKRADQYVTALYGNKETRTNTDDIDKVRKTFIEQNKHELVDPIGILNKIECLEKEIYDFKTNVDEALSVSNATTTIDIEY